MKSANYSKYHPIEDGYIDENNLIAIFRIDRETHVIKPHHLPTKAEGGAVCICLEGEAVININTEKYEIRKDDLFMIFPSSIIQLISKSEDFIGYILGVDSRYFTEIDLPSVAPVLMTIRDNPCISLTEEEVNLLIELGEMIKRKVSRTDHVYRNEIAGKLLAVLFHEISAIYRQRKPVGRKKRSRDEEIFEKFLYLVAMNHKEQRSITFYASMLYLTPKYLSSVIKNVSGSTASQWIARMVIINAKTMLKTTDMTVQQVSDTLCFPNPSFFGQFFKKHTGMTPRSFKQS